MNGRSSNDYTKYYDNLVEIGIGAYTIVYKGREIKTNKLRAIKVIKLDKIKGDMLEYENPEMELKKCIDGYINECENMKICRNVFSVKFYEYFSDENNFVIIMELCDSNLLNLLLKKKMKDLV